MPCKLNQNLICLGPRPLSKCLRSTLKLLTNKNAPFAFHICVSFFHIKTSLYIQFHSSLPYLKTLYLHPIVLRTSPSTSIKWPIQNTLHGRWYSNSVKLNFGHNVCAKNTMSSTRGSKKKLSILDDKP
jgi:hypothetical protein